MITRTNLYIYSVNGWCKSVGYIVLISHDISLAGMSIENNYTLNPYTHTHTGMSSNIQVSTLQRFILRQKRE